MIREAIPTFLYKDLCIGEGMEEINQSLGH